MLPSYVTLTAMMRNAYHDIAERYDLRIGQGQAPQTPFQNAALPNAPKMYHLEGRPVLAAVDVEVGIADVQTGLPRSHDACDFSFAGHSIVAASPFLRLPRLLPAEWPFSMSSRADHSCLNID